MNCQVFGINGKKIKEIKLPEVFKKEIREDIVAKVLEAKKHLQPYGASPVAGKQHAAKGKIVHRRHVWRSGYGRGISRVPRKIFSQKGSQFVWEAAEVPQARGGMRAHPPKPISKINTKKINKKELKIALESAIASTANKELIIKRYSSLKEKDLPSLPLIIESKITSLKTKELISSIKKLLGEAFKVCIKKRKVRAGKGKSRGRKYKKSGGLLIVVGKGEKLKTNAFEVASTENLSVLDIAKGGLGRLTLYTEQAIKDLEKRK